MFEDSRERNGKPLRGSWRVQHLDVDEQGETLPAYIYESSISCLVTGLDDNSWVSKLFIDTYYQGEESSESVEHYHSIHSSQNTRLDALRAGIQPADFPIWNPREYFLVVFECRLEQVKHASHNLVVRLLLKLEPYVSLMLLCILTATK
jgi:hypothetical protein